MQRITPDRPWPLFDVSATRGAEQAAAAHLPAHTLMQRAGLAVARLALAVTPHARVVWVACGPGNNGGDGFEAAVHLQRWGKSPVVTWGSESAMPGDAQTSLQRARAAGVEFAPEPPKEWDLGIDAMLGIGANRPLEGRMLEWMRQLNAASAPVLAVDVPSGLSTDTGAGLAVQATHTLSLLSLKPGFFTAQGRDAAGQIWFDDLGIAIAANEACAILGGPPAPVSRAHATHKGSYGDVAVIGGAPGMSGAALLAGRAALHHGAGRVFVALLDGGSLKVDPHQPDLMMRDWDTLDLSGMSVACGCGGGEVVRTALPSVLSRAKALVLDADALNAIAVDPQLQALLQTRGRSNGKLTVLTPHPLEAARILETTAAEVQANRLRCATELSQRFACVVLLKGSGTVIAAPEGLPVINPTGNARLATAGTGDVLSGWIAARMAAGLDGFEAACAATYAHGQAADRWPAEIPLSASALARHG